MSVLSIDQLFYMIIRSNQSLTKQYYRNHNGNINYYTKPKILKSYADTIADFEDLDNIIVYIPAKVQNNANSLKNNKFVACSSTLV